MKLYSLGLKSLKIRLKIHLRKLKKSIYNGLIQMTKCLFKNNYKTPKYNLKTLGDI